MRKYTLVVTTLALLFSGCSSAVEDAKDDDVVTQATSAITQSGTATLTFTSQWATGYCANLNVKNTGANQSNSWLVYINMFSATYTSSGNATVTTGKGVILIRPSANNGVIPPGGTVNPVPSFCASRPAGTPLPTVGAVTTNFCGMAYKDSDGDGYGAGSLVYTCDSTGYASKNGDCCDSDGSAFPGQTLAADIPNRCGTFDYSCDGVATKQSNGPTGCFEAPLTCTMSGTTCVPSAAPAGCNGGFATYGTANCGEEWYISAKGCSRICRAGSCSCSTYSTGGPGGLQLCR